MRIEIMAGVLANKKIAILATDGFEYVELIEPRKALDAAGAKTEVVSPKQGEIKGWKFTDWGDSVKVDVNLASADASDYDGLLLPGGVINPDKLRTEPKAVAFVKAFFEADKPVAAICHGPWMLVEAGVVNGRKLASWPSIRTDIRNAGGEWVDEPVVTDQRIVTSRKPDDIPAFNQKILELFAGNRQQAQSA